MSSPDPGLSEWLARARAGSPEALGRVLELCRNYLLHVADRQLDADLRAKGGASDLVQETFLEAQRDFAGFGGTTEDELLAWVRRILLNNAANFARRYHTGKRDLGREVGPAAADSGGSGPVPTDPVPTPSRLAVEREQAEALRAAIDRLPDEYRRVIVLRYLEGRSFEDIGAEMGRSPEAARKLWARAMDRLRRDWEASHDTG